MLDRLSIYWYTLTMNRLDINKQTQIIRCLAEGNSIRGTSRITGNSKDTVMKLLVDVGKACIEYQDKAFHDLNCKRIQCDEIWSFCYAKEKNVPEGKKGQFGYGDVWTWTAICADTKLVPSWVIGNRDYETAEVFIDDLASRLKNRVQLTTDGHKAYLEAVEGAFGCEIDYSQLIKLYGNDGIKGEGKYSPGECTGTKINNVTGNPDPKHVSTSCMEAGVTDHAWDIKEILALINSN